MRVDRLVLFVGATSAGAACGLFPSLDGLSGGDAALDGASDAPADVAIDASDGGSVDAAPDGPCVSLHGPAMVQVPTGFCIDSTEVTNAQYAEFVDAVVQGATIATPPGGVCAWNSTITPLTTSTTCTADVTDANAHPSRPVSCIDWCDAYAYCAWAGKRLCGATDGGVLDFSEYATTSNQSFVACSANGTRTYPYGSTYAKGACNTKDLYDASALPVVAVDVKSFAQCVGGYPGIYDITGNVEEWTDSCAEKNEGGANDLCHEFGDTFDYTYVAPARCDSADSDNRDFRVTDVGVRCCSP